MVIYSQYKFQEIHSLVTWLWLRTEKLLKFRQSKGDKSSIARHTNETSRAKPNYGHIYI